MASCTEPPYTPECRSLSLHSTLRTHSHSVGCSRDSRSPRCGRAGRGRHRARSEIKVCCPRGLARHSLNHKAAATRAPPGGRRPAHLDEEVADAPQPVGDAGLVCPASSCRRCHVVHVPKNAGPSGAKIKGPGSSEPDFHAPRQKRTLTGDFLGRGRCEGESARTDFVFP